MQVTRQIELETGQSIGPYVLLFALGKGGDGQVWAAQRENRIGAHNVVALKLIERSEHDDLEFFLDEARAAARLHHTAIVPCLDLGREGPWLYMAMELVRGPSLFALLSQAARDRERLPPAFVWWIGRRVASALDYAHARAEGDGRPLHLVHRDISPQNILCDAAGNVRVTDFGIARTSIQRHRSLAGAFIGKPSYMSPEQARGAPIDARTDIFSLGTVLYECAMGRRLFYSREGVESTLQRVITFEPPDLSNRIDGFPPSLARVVGRTLEKDPDHRFASAADLLTALDEATPRVEKSSTAQIDLGHWIDQRFGAESFELIETPDVVTTDATRILPRQGQWPTASTEQRAIMPAYPLPAKPKQNGLLLAVLLMLTILTGMSGIVLWMRPVEPALPPASRTQPTKSQPAVIPAPTLRQKPSVSPPSKEPPPPQTKAIRRSRPRPRSPAGPNDKPVSPKKSSPPTKTELFRRIRALDLPDTQRNALLMELTEIPADAPRRLSAFAQKLAKQ